MNPNVLTVYESPFNKIRVGKEYDGGYIISDIPIVYDILISGGVADDISFEEEFTKKYNVPCIAFDGTIEFSTDNTMITYIKQNIGYDNNEYTTNLHDIINKHKSIFIKMDIEGHEVSWINSLTADHMNRFQQIAIEFHSPFTNKEIEMFDKLNETHLLIHFHGNNSNPLIYHNGIYIPNVFECTYIHKKYVTSYTLNTNIIPGILDKPNLSQYPDIILNYPPFVFPYALRLLSIIPYKPSSILQIGYEYTSFQKIVNIYRDIYLIDSFNDSKQYLRFIKQLSILSYPILNKIHSYRGLYSVSVIQVNSIDILYIYCDINIELCYQTVKHNGWIIINLNDKLLYRNIQRFLSIHINSFEIHSILHNELYIRRK